MVFRAGLEACRVAAHLDKRKGLSIVGLCSSRRCRCSRIYTVNKERRLREAEELDSLPRSVHSTSKTFFADRYAPSKLLLAASTCGGRSLVRLPKPYRRAEQSTRFPVLAPIKPRSSIEGITSASPQLAGDIPAGRTWSFLFDIEGSIKIFSSIWSSGSCWVRSPRR